MNRFCLAEHLLMTQAAQDNGKKAGSISLRDLTLMFPGPPYASIRCGR